MNLWWILLSAFLISYIATPWVKKLAFKVGATDEPCARKVHQKIMPRMGGLAIYFAFTATILLTQELNRAVLGLLIGGLIIIIVGVLDDLYCLSPKVKLIGQIGAALVLVAFGYRVDFVSFPWGNELIWLKSLSIPFTIVWIIGICNAVNLIDGLDGLAAGTSAIAALTMAFIAFFNAQSMVFVLALILAASILGFLKYNFNPAQIFMGDSGSLFLGFNLGALAILGLTKGATLISLFIPIVILGIPIMDTAFAIMRRFLNGKPIFEPDKNHLHHCLLQHGLSHKQTVLAIYGINLCLGISAIFLDVFSTAQSYVMLLGIATVVIIGANKLGVLSVNVGKSRSTNPARLNTMKQGKVKLHN